MKRRSFPWHGPIWNGTFVNIQWCENFGVQTKQSHRPFFVANHFNPQKPHVSTQLPSVWDENEIPPSIFTCPPKRNYSNNKYIFQPLIFREKLKVFWRANEINPTYLNHSKKNMEKIPDAFGGIRCRSSNQRKSSQELWPICNQRGGSREEKVHDFGRCIWLGLRDFCVLEKCLGLFECSGFYVDVIGSLGEKLFGGNLESLDFRF